MPKTRQGFVCLGGCGGFSPKAKTCGSGGCAHYGKPLAKGFKCAECGETFAKGRKHKHK